MVALVVAVLVLGAVALVARCLVWRWRWPLLMGTKKGRVYTPPAVISWPVLIAPGGGLRWVAWYCWPRPTAPLRQVVAAAYL